MSQSLESIIEIATSVATREAAAPGNGRYTPELKAAIESACDLLAERPDNSPQLQALIKLSRKACGSRRRAAHEPRYG